MTDVVYTQISPVRRAAFDAVPGKGDGPNLKIISSGRVPTALTVGQTIRFARLDSATRLHGLSAFQYAANAASTTMSIGLASVNDNFGAAVPAALLAATSIAAAGRTQVPAIANCGLPLWQIAGLTADPGGQIDVYGVVGGATLNGTSAVLLELALSID